MNHNETFGHFVRERRLSLDLGLRDFCEVTGLDPGNYSKVERGLAKPPTGEKLEPYRLALNIERDSDEDKELKRLAFVSAGRIPAQIMSDKELAGKLPVLFRILEEGKLTDEALNKLYELVREAHSPEIEESA